MRVVGWLMLGVLFLAPLPGATAGGSSRVELLAALKTENLDLIMEELSQVRSMHNQQDLLPVVQNLWEGRTRDHGVSPRLASLDIVRVELGAILAQAYANGDKHIDVRPINAFLREKIRSSDRQVAINAISSMSWFDNRADIDALTEIAKQSDYRFRATVVTLSRMCDAKAREALGRLRNELPEQASYIESVVQRSEAFKADTTWCRAR